MLQRRFGSLNSVLKLPSAGLECTTNRPARADSRSLQEDGWFKTSSTATIWMAASRVRRSRTVFQSDRSSQAARMESAWRGDSGLPAPIRPLKLTPSVRAPATAPQLRTSQRLYMCRRECFGMRLRRINRPKAALSTMNGVT